jgi:formate/nitrite transporter FocA (FNT family)
VLTVATDLQHDVSRETEPKKPSRQILQDEISEGVDALQRPVIVLFISGLSAGLDVGFSLFLMAVVRTLFEDSLGEAALVPLVANMYAVGFIFVVLGRSELFTEQTTLAVLPVLNRRAGIDALARLWAVVFVANLLGAAAFAALAVKIGPALGVIDPRAFGTIARTMTEHEGHVIFASAVLAGWLMGLMSWLVAAGRDTISQIALVWLIATVIGLCRLHHVVVGSVEVLAGIFAGQGVSAADYGRFVLWATLGNAVGGSVFVALIKYSYAITGKQPD